MSSIPPTAFRASVSPPARQLPRTVLWIALALAWCVGLFGRGFWTPDEPREADIAWRMSWQPDKAVPLLAGEAFCEKPPLTYWLAGASIRSFGLSGWAARLPNLFYALLTACSVAALARRALGGSVAAPTAAMAIGTFLLAYQVAIWLATDAPLLGFVSLALLGVHWGFYARDRSQRLLGYGLMHTALGLAFLCKSAAAWMVPALTLGTLVAWERRWRELLRWELYVGLALQAAIILSWVWSVYVGPEGAAHLKVFFWNNLVGRFARVDAPDTLQYAAAHRNTPGKYWIELPLYLMPWTLLVGAAARRAWTLRHAWALRPATPSDHADAGGAALRFAIAASLPSLVVLSVAATARNIYLAPALPGFALLLAWWAGEAGADPQIWDLRALRATAVLLLAAAAVTLLGAALIAADAWGDATGQWTFICVTLLSLGVASTLLLRANRAAHRRQVLPSLFALALAYCVLLVGPASQIYPRVDAWQDLASIGRNVQRASQGEALIAFAADETTRAFLDIYARTSLVDIPGPIDAKSLGLLRQTLANQPRSRVVVQIPGRSRSALLENIGARLGIRVAHHPANAAASQYLPWADPLKLTVVEIYALPNGRRYALLTQTRAMTDR